MRRQTPEGSVKKAVCDLLDAERIPYHRLQSGKIIREHNGKRYAVGMCAKGTADLIALMPCQPHPMPVYIETKRPKGGVQSPAQKEFEARAKAVGIGYLLVSDPTQLQQWLKEAR